MSGAYQIADKTVDNSECKKEDEKDVSEGLIRSSKDQQVDEHIRLNEQENGPDPCVEFQPYGEPGVHTGHDGLCMY